MTETNPTTQQPAHTPGPWRLLEDAQGPNMVMHPTREGVAIASLTNTFKPTNGFHEDWGTDDGSSPTTIAERNANARLIASAPTLLSALEKAAGALQNISSTASAGATKFDASEAARELTIINRAARKAVREIQSAIAAAKRES